MNQAGPEASGSQAAIKAARSPRLILEIAVVLLCKLAVIFALWFFFFGPDKRIDQTPENIAAGVLDRAPSADIVKNDQ